MQFRALPADILGGIRTLELREASIEDLNSAAKVHLRLTSLRTIKCYSGSAVPYGADPFASAAFAKLADQVETLSLDGVCGQAGVLFGQAEQLVRPATLRGLRRFPIGSVFASDFDILPRTLTRLDRIESLEIFDELYPHFAVISIALELADPLRLSRLRKVVRPRRLCLWQRPRAQRRAPRSVVRH